jgi:hypothetical protein
MFYLASVEIRFILSTSMEQVGTVKALNSFIIVYIVVGH